MYHRNNLGMIYFSNLKLIGSLTIRISSENHINMVLFYIKYLKM